MGHLQTDEQLAVAEIKGTTRPTAGRSENLTKFQNPFSDLFTVEKFHHVEFWCGDASNSWRRFSWGLGMNLVAKSDQSTGNCTYCSYAIQSNDLLFSFTAPYSQKIDQSNSKIPHPGFKAGEAKTFFEKHGLAVRAVALLVKDAEAAYKVAVENGGIGVLEPVVLGAGRSLSGDTSGTMKMAEVQLCGDLVLRLVSNHGFTGPYLPDFEPVNSPPISYGIQRVDHAASNVASLADSMTYLGKFTGFHEFSEYTAEDLLLVSSGLNSLVVANNNETVLLSMNKPVFGTKTKSQIQTYLEQNEGPGMQHLALICDDIFSTLREMRMRTHLGGFDFMPRPPPTYYQHLPERIGSILTEEQFKECEELGVMVDKDDEGVLLQIFTQPVGDRPTIFVELIQRVGCMQQASNNLQKVQKGGCGGFGKGNFAALFRSVEEYEKTLSARTKEHQV